MTLLLRYILGRHTRLVLMTLAVGLGLYILTEMVERLDTFVDSGVGVSVILIYFLARLPSIAAQILPAVFILASVITLCLMIRSREALALESGGVSPQTITGALLICGLLWGGVQLGLSQFLGASGTALADKIWTDDVRKANELEHAVYDLWFTDGKWIVSVMLMGRDGLGTTLTAYELSAGSIGFESIVKAYTFEARPGAWQLQDVERTYPRRFMTEHLEALVLPLSQDPDVFFVGNQENPQSMPLSRLSEAIDVLGDSGSNVEGLITAWHSRLAYAASLLVMAVLAAAVVSWQRNIYVAVGLSILICFLFYISTVMGQSMGERGIVPPVIAAWGPQVLLFGLASLRLYWVSSRN